VAEPSTPTHPDPTVVYQALVTIVRDWRERGRKTTTAGLKSALQQANPDFSEKTYGYATFRELVQAATAAGHLRVQKLANGHTYVLLPGEAEVPELPAPTTDEQHDLSGARLRRDVWSTVVDWHPHHHRLWDRDTRRAFAYPVDAQGSPAWTSAPDRFVTLPEVDKDVQLDWMREWASQQDQSIAPQLLASIGAEAPAGQFRRTLLEHDLAAAWREELQNRVGAHVTAWSRRHNIDVADLADHRATPIRSPRPTGARATDVVNPATTVSTSAAVPADASDPESLLRAKLHRVLDRMSFAELTAIQVSAAYLLED
jgi:hypothetical protein